MNPLSSLGVGSGVLNYDIIDKLKKADENAQIAPIDRKLQKNVEKQAELVGLKTMLSSLKGNAKNIADYSSYLERKVSSSDESVLKVSVGAGVPVQNISVKVNAIARNSINEVGLKLSSRDDVLSRSNTQFKFHLNGKDFKINISSSDTLNDVAQKIIDETNGAVNASIMKTGEGRDAYSLMINSKETGASNNIYFGNTLISKEIAAMPSLGSGDLSVNLSDKNGNKKTLNITLGAEAKSPEALKNAILAEASKDAELNELIQNGEINIDTEGKKLILNDKRGFEISVEGKKAGEIFSQKEVKEDDTVVGDREISGGQIKGTITIGSANLNLANLTAESNTKEMNQNAIIKAINAIEGYQAHLTKDGHLAINSTSGEVKIKASEENKEALRNLGLEAGDFKDWSVFERDLNLRNLQKASDANLTYNGIEVSRPKNTIDDVVSGVSLELLSASDKDIHIAVNRNNDEIIKQVREFVDNYNALIPKLDELTRYDEDTKIAGIFNGVSDIRAIRGSLNRALSHTSTQGGRYESMATYGLSLNDNGTLSFDESKLQSALSADADKVSAFFRGGKATINGKEIDTQGMFSLVLKELDALTTGENARLKLFEDSIASDDKRLKDDRARNLEMLQNRYDIMANRFAAYDSQIAKANRSFNSLNMLIEQSMGDKNK